MAYTEDVNVNLNVLAGAMGGITAIMGGMSALTSTFGQFGTEAVDNFGAVDGLLVSTTGLLVSFGVQAAQAFGEFEQGMKIVQAVSNQSGSAINELSNKANEMSIAYRTSIGDITDGLQTLGRAGLNSVNEQLEVLESGLQTAKLEGRSLNGVLEELIQNTAMLGGDLKSVNFGEQTEYLNSLMVGTSMTAPINSHDISQTLQYAGGTAAAAGANLEDKEKLEDLMGTIAAFAQKGVTGSMAGTALRAFFTKPASQDKSVTEGLEMIGLTPDRLWEDGGESMKDVSDQIGIIQRQMDNLNLSTMEQIEIWGKIVGPKMGQQMMKLDSASIKDLTRDIQSAQSAEDLATQTLQTYTQKVNEMQQQGDLAFREFGEHIVVFLTPVVEIITKILGLLSEPHINLAVFATLASLVRYGIGKAWGMITSLFGQINRLLTGVTAEVSQFNALAGGSASGFNQSAASVDVLNAKLAETNSELMMMQAQFLKIKGLSSTGTYVAPLGLTNSQGQIPKGVISTAPQKVFVGNGGVGEKGTYYDPSDKARLEKEYRDSMAKQNAEATKRLDRFYKNSVTTDSRGRTQYRGDGGKFISKEEFQSRESAMLKDNRVLTGKEIDKNVENAFKNGGKEIHSSMVSMSSAEYNKWMKGLKNSTDPLKQFNYKRQLELEKHAGDKATNTVGGQKFHRVVRFDPIQKRFNEYERLLQKEGQFKQFEQKRADLVNQRRAQIRGRGQGVVTGVQQGARSIQSRAMQATEKQWARLTSNLSAANMALHRFIPGLNNIGPQMGVKVNQLIDSIAPQLQNGTMNVEEALLMLREETGLTATELSVLLEDATVLAGGFDTLSQKIAGLATTTQADMAAEEAHIQSVLMDKAATDADSASKLKDAAMNGLKSLVGFMGGPLMFAMMGFMFAMQAIQESQRKWQEQMQEALNQLSEARDKLSSAEEEIKNQYSSENNNLSDADLDKALDTQYAAVYDAFYSGTEADRTKLENHTATTDPSVSGEYNEDTKQYEMLTEEEIAARNDTMEEFSVAKDENVRALDENTMALAAATAAYNQSLENAAKEFRDGSWGFDSFTANASDQLGEWQEEIWNTGAWATGVDAREGFFDSNSPVLSASQKDKNYEGSTEFAPIFMADVYRFGTNKGAEELFGSDFDRIYGLMDSMDKKISTKYGQSGLSGADAMATHAANFSSFGPNAVDAKTMSLMQMSMKDNKEDYQKLGKQMFRQEQSHGFKGSAYNDYLKASGMKQRGEAKTIADAMKKIKGGKLTVQDKNMIQTMQKMIAMTGGKLDEANILAMGQLQQLQDMYTVANETVAPGIMQTVQGVYQNVSATGTASANAGSAAGGANTAGANAAAIASILGAQAQGAAEGYAYDKWKRTGATTIDGMKVDNQDDFVKALANQGPEAKKWESEVLQTLSGSGWSVNHPGATPDQIKKNSERLAGEDSALMKSDASYQSKLNTATSMLTEYMTGAIEVAYDQSSIGEYGNGSRDVGSGGGGGSSDGGSGSNKDNTGTRRERVDLVLCNKKEIPKLNVNLFKKPPNFTILNKNFKLRDIKINSQDKPKAIMNAVKNGIIETQKRMDPKIIQDETADYDPLESTDGKSVPSGTTKTTT